MIRTEKHPVGAALGEVAFVNVYGFGWDAADSENNVSSASRVVATLEYEDGSRVVRVLRAATWYGGPRRIRRVWLTSSVAGDLVIARGDDPGDLVVFTPAPPSNTPIRQSQETIIPAGYVFTGAESYKLFTPPAWARQASIDALCMYTGVVGGAAFGCAVYLLDAVTGTRVARLYSGSPFVTPAEVGDLRPIAGLGPNPNGAGGGPPSVLAYYSGPHAPLQYGLELSFAPAVGWGIAGGPLIIRRDYWGVP